MISAQPKWFALNVTYMYLEFLSTLIKTDYYIFILTLIVKMLNAPG